MTVVVSQASGKVVLGPTLPVLLRTSATDAPGLALYRKFWAMMKGWAAPVSFSSQNTMLSPVAATSLAFMVASMRTSRG